MDSTEKSESNNRKHSEDLDISAREIFINLIITSLPHLALIVIFVIYALVGAAILKEIENDKSLHFKDNIEIIPKNNLEIREFLNHLKIQNDKYLNNQKNLLDNFSVLIDENLNKTRLKQEKSVDDDSNEKNTNKLISNILKRPNLNITDVFKTIAKNVIQYKKQLKRNLNSNLKQFLNDFESKQALINKNINRLIDINLNNIDNIISTSDNNGKNVETNRKKVYEWDFKRAVYFIGSLLTTLGYNDVSPNTLMGKFFIMVYLTIGVPLTCIVLSDLGSLFTQICKFNYHFIEIFYNNGYYDDFKRTIKSKFSDKKKKKYKYKKQISTKDPFDETDDDDSKNLSSQLSSDCEEKGFFQIFIEVTVSSIEKSNDKFDLSIGLVFSIVFFYLTLGAFITSRLNGFSLSKGFYFTVIALTKINLGDIGIKDTSSFILLTIYFLLGLSFVDLTLLTLQDKIRYLIIKNGKNIITEFCKFANQLGYNWTGGHMMQVLDSMGINPFFKSSSFFTQQVKVAVNEENETEQLNTPTKNRNKKFRYSFENVKKCDKQTQITTLLCSRFKMDGRDLSSMSASCSNLSDLSTSPVQISSIRPNLLLDKLEEENLTRRDRFDVGNRSRLTKSDRFSFESPLAPTSFSNRKSGRFN